MSIFHIHFYSHYVPHKPSIEDAAFEVWSACRCGKKRQDFWMPYQPRLPEMHQWGDFL